MDSSWYVPDEVAAPAAKQSIFESVVEHFANITLDGIPCEEVRTGFMCDIGISNYDVKVIQRLIASGMTITRVKLRDINPDIVTKIIQNIRQAVFNYSTDFLYVYPLAIILDVKGPPIVTGSIKNDKNVQLLKGETLKLTMDAKWKFNGTAELIYVGYDHLTDLLKGDVIFIDSLNSEKVKLVVHEVGYGFITCKVLVSGLVGSKMSVHIMQTPHDLQEATPLAQESTASLASDLLEHMNQQIAWAVSSDVDAVLVSHTQFASDILLVKECLGHLGKHILVIVTIDTENALRNIDEILDKADGIYLDRITLATDFPLEKIFIAQKMVMAKCNYLGKPCICRVVMNEKLPTLCVTDVANMIIDGADVLSLQIQYDSLLKKFDHTETEKCISAVSVVARHTERISMHPLKYRDTELLHSLNKDPSTAMCISAVELCLRSVAVVVICLTNSGRTAKILSHMQPACPIIAVTRTCHTARQLRFWKGIRSIHYFAHTLSAWPAEVEARVNTALEYCLVKRIIRIGDPYVVLSNSRKDCGYCDCVKLKFLTNANIPVN